MANTKSFGLKGWLRLIAGVAWLAVFVKWPRITFAFTLLLIGGIFIAFNAMVFWRTMIRKEEAPSAAPIFGGIIAGAGMAILPVEGIWKWAWLPLLLDWGGLPMLMAWFVRRGRS